MIKNKQFRWKNKNNKLCLFYGGKNIGEIALKSNNTYTSIITFYNYSTGINNIKDIELAKEIVINYAKYYLYQHNCEKLKQYTLEQQNG